MITNEPKARINPVALDLAGVPDEYRGARLADIPPDYQGAKIVYRYAETIVRQLLNGVGLRLGGPGGHGKTYAAVALLKRAVAHGASVMFAEASLIPRSLFDKDRYVQRDVFSDPIDMRAKIETVEFLVIDDLGSEHGSKFSQRAVETLLRHRLPRNRTTLITTNLPNSDLLDQYGAPMIEFMAPKVHPVVFMGIDWRERQRAATRKDLEG